jgi:hypothetical protein
VDGWGGEGATFYYFDFDGVPQSYYVNPITLPVFEDMTVTAYYIYGK